MEKKHPDFLTIIPNFVDDPISANVSVKCGNEECKFFYAELTNKKYNNSAKPTVLFVGGFHGDERLGPNIVTELCATLLENKHVTPIKEFLENNLILLKPMVNPYGYYHQGRMEETNGIFVDINRDFNYNVDKDKHCFQSKGARALAEIYKNYLVQLGITFHGGDNVLSWPWGSMNHLLNGNTH